MGSKINSKWIKDLNVKCKCKELFKPNNKKMNNPIEYQGKQSKEKVGGHGLQAKRLVEISNLPPDLHPRSTWVSIIVCLDYCWIPSVTDNALHIADCPRWRGSRA